MGIPDIMFEMNQVRNGGEYRKPRIHRARSSIFTFTSQTLLTQINKLFRLYVSQAVLIVAQMMLSGGWLNIIAKSELGSDCSIINARSELRLDLHCSKLSYSNWE